jgi:hypothetical protein
MRDAAVETATSSYFKVLRSMTSDPRLLAIADEVERDTPGNFQRRSVTFTGEWEPA